jgi:hypothetical protein
MWGHNALMSNPLCFSLTAIVGANGKASGPTAIARRHDAVAEYKRQRSDQAILFAVLYLSLM